jgi:hypothetical protein
MTDWWGTLSNATTMLSEGLQTVTTAIEQDFASAQAQSKPSQAQSGPNTMTTSVWDEWDDDQPTATKQQQQQLTKESPHAKPRGVQSHAMSTSTGLNLSADSGEGSGGSVRTSQALSSSAQSDEWGWDDDSRKRSNTNTTTMEPIRTSPSSSTSQPRAQSKPTSPMPSSSRDGTRVQPPLTSNSPPKTIPSDNNNSNNSDNAIESNPISPNAKRISAPQDTSQSEWADDWDNVSSSLSRKETSRAASNNSSSTTPSLNSSLSKSRDENSANDEGVKENLNTVREISRDEEPSSENEDEIIASVANGKSFSSSEGVEENRDQTSDDIVAEVSSLPNAEETLTPRYNNNNSGDNNPTFDEPIPIQHFPVASISSLEGQETHDRSSNPISDDNSVQLVNEHLLQPISPILQSQQQSLHLAREEEGEDNDNDESEVTTTPNATDSHSSEVVALKEQLRVLLADRGQQERAREGAEAELKQLRDIMVKKDQLFRTTDSEMRAAREELIKKENLLRTQDTQLNVLKDEVNKKDKQSRESGAELQILKNSFGGKDEILLKLQSENKQLRYASLVVVFAFPRQYFLFSLLVRKEAN